MPFTGQKQSIKVALYFDIYNPRETEKHCWEMPLIRNKEINE
jgi:hypothetical protein